MAITSRSGGSQIRNRVDIYRNSRIVRMTKMIRSKTTGPHPKDLALDLSVMWFKSMPRLPLCRARSVGAAESATVHGSAPGDWGEAIPKQQLANYSHPDRPTAAAS